MVAVHNKAMTEASSEEWGVWKRTRLATVGVRGWVEGRAGVQRARMPRKLCTGMWEWSATALTHEGF